MDVDDDETAEFRLKIKGASKVMLPLSVNYRDANNNKYNQIFNIELKIYSAKDMGVSKNGIWKYTFIVLIIIGVLYAFFYTAYRKWRKNEEEGVIDYISYLIERYVFKAKND